MPKNRLPPFAEQMDQLLGCASVSSSDPNLDMSNRGVVELLADWLDRLGFATRLEPVDAASGKYNLIASLGGGTGGLVLAGHADTVPCDEPLWESDPFAATRKTAGFYGLGATDMKGFFAVALAAIEGLDLRALHKPLTVVATADEESSMAGARLLARQGLEPGEAVLIGEPTDLRPVRMHKGVLMQCIRITGASGHSSNPALGNNALDAMHEVLGALLGFRTGLQARYRHAGFHIQVPTLNLGCIHGGDNPNRICGQCAMQFDLRPLPGMSLDALRDEIDALLAPIAAARAIDIRHEPLFAGVAPFEEPADSALVRRAETLTGTAAQSVAYATEAPFFQSLGKQTLVLGPGSIDQAHRPNEYLPAAQIAPAIDLYRQFIRHYCC
ncbi:MAG: acetylornithine deacetylase [Cellvibrionales bacterium]|nr:acetylornithine deacetylase [Cellvibrionales bacterium]